MVEQCGNLNPGKRPSSLMLLQIARQEVRKFSQANEGSALTFLPHAVPTLSYIEQVVSEIFDRYCKLLKRHLYGKKQSTDLDREQQSADFVQLAKRIRILLYESRPQDVGNFSQHDWHLLSMILPLDAIEIKSNPTSEQDFLVRSQLGFTDDQLKEVATDSWAQHESQKNSSRAQRQSRKKAHRVGNQTKH